MTEPRYAVTRFRLGMHQCLDEVVLSLVEGLRALGHDAWTRDDGYDPDPSVRAIVLVPQYIATGHIPEPPPQSILYNLEQVSRDSGWLHGFAPPLVKSLFSRWETWDYSAENVARLRGMGVEAKLCPFGWVPSMKMPRPSTPKDLDVVFFGSALGRRQRVMDALRSTGLRVFQGVGLFGEEREKICDRAHLVLNLAYYDAPIFEVVRVIPLLVQGRLVVSEDRYDPVADRFAEAVRFSPYEDIVDACLSLLRDADAQARMLVSAQAILPLFRQEDFLLPLVGRGSLQGAIAAL